MIEVTSQLKAALEFIMDQALKRGGLKSWDAVGVVGLALQTALQPKPAGDNVVQMDRPAS